MNTSYGQKIGWHLTITLKWLSPHVPPDFETLLWEFLSIHPQEHSWDQTLVLCEEAWWTCCSNSCQRCSVRLRTPNLSTPTLANYFLLGPHMEHRGIVKPKQDRTSQKLLIYTILRKSYWNIRPFIKSELLAVFKLDVLD